MAHPDIACPGETHLLSACARFLRQEATPQGVEMGVIPGLRLLGFDERVVHERLRELAFGFHREHARQQGKPRFGMKTAVDSFYVDEVEGLAAGHARFVCIVRHGLDVVASMSELTRETGAFLTELHEYIQDSTWPGEAYARAWADTTAHLTAFAARHPEDAVLVRYEDLVQRPDEVLDHMLDRLQAPRVPDLVERALREPEDVGLGDWKTYRVSSMTRRSIGRYRKLPKPMLTQILPIVEEGLRAHGYEVPELEPEVDPHSDRRTRLAMLLNMAKNQDL